MKKKYKWALLLLVVVGLAGVAIAATQLRQGPQITAVENIALFCEEQGVSLSDTEAVQYHLLDERRVLIVDQRNAESREYTHSTVAASQDQSGTLTVKITDVLAVSEGDISGSFAVVIECSAPIQTVVLERKDETN